MILYAETGSLRVSIHAPTWGATRQVSRGGRGVEFQSTHPRGVRHDNTRRYHYSGDVSIHAPTWGATASNASSVKAFIVSIHAPTWGATSIEWTRILPRMFQSTHPRGVRQTWTCADTECHIVSIHAPTWGATFCSSTSNCALMFQSTHPRGVRPGCSLISAAFSSFNPRTHVGCDIETESRQKAIAVSIHAPTWGATHSVSKCRRHIQVSIHAPTWGATRDCQHLDSQCKVSIHAPTWGATPLNVRKLRI